MFQRDTMFSTVYNSQDVEATKMSIERWMDKDVIHLYNGILLCHERERNNVIHGDMDRQWVKSNRERQIYQFYAESKKKKKWYKWTYLQNSHRCRKLPQGGRGGKLGDGVWHILTTMYKTTNKDLLYSTENSLSYSIMTYMGTESKKGWMYLYNWITLLSSRNQHIINQLCSNKNY